MSRTYNGRFSSPEEPKGGGKWIAIGCGMIPLWSIPLFGMGVLAGSVCCFVKGGKMSAERRMYRRFHEMCAVIGKRTRVSIRELARVMEMSKNDMRKYLQKMIAAGYFGEEAYLDMRCEELILPAVDGAQEDRPSMGGWKNLLVELMHTLKVDQLFQEPVREAQAEKQQNTESKEVQQQTSEREKTVQQGTEKKKTYMDDLERTLAELYDLNERISDEAVSERIDRIGTLTASIFRVVIEKPEREADVRRFMNYYLPTTLKLLKSYDMLEDQSYQGENIVASRQKIESVLDMLIQAYEKQLDRLFHDDALDIATDIDVLETMMAGDGLSSRGRMPGL